MKGILLSLALVFTLGANELSYTEKHVVTECYNLIAEPTHHDTEGAMYIAGLLTGTVMSMDLQGFDRPEVTSYPELMKEACHRLNTRVVEGSSITTAISTHIFDLLLEGN